MVAAESLAARPAIGELALVRQLGSLLHSRAVIERRRWRAYATARLIPVFALYNLPLDRLRDDLRDDTGIVCPEPLWPVLQRLLDDELAREVPRVDVIARVVEARWRPGYAACVFEATAAALRANAHDAIAELQTHVPARLARKLRVFAVSGVTGGPWGTFHGDLDHARTFPASPALVVALVERAIRERARDQIAMIDELASKLGTLDRRRAAAHIARAVLVVDGPRAAELRLRAMREDSVRDAGWYLVAREAIGCGDHATADRFASQVRKARLVERLRIATAWGVFRAGEPLRARRLLGTCALPELAFEHWRLRSTIALAVRNQPQSLWWASSRRDHAAVLPGWFGEAEPELWDQARVIHGGSLLFGRDPDHGHRMASIDLGLAVRDPRTRRETIEMFDDVGVDAFVTIARLRERAATDRLQPYDILFAELIAVRADTIAKARAALPAWTRAGIAGDRPPVTRAALRRREEADRIRRANDDAATVAELLGQLRPQAECPPAAERRTALEEQRSLDRALYDEGTTWDAPRRLGIVTAARACLHAAVEDPAGWDPDLIECRIRTLGLLGGTAPRETIESALAHSQHDRFTLRLYEALCWIDPQAAARAAIQRAIAPRDGEDPVLREVLSLVEAYRGVLRGFAHAWCATYRALHRELTPRQARAFLASLTRLRGVPDAALLEWVAARASERRLTDAGSMLGDAQEACASLTRVWPVDAARMLAEDRVLRETSHLWSGVRVVTRARTWGDVEWTMMLRRAGSVQTGVVDRGVVRRCARALRCDEDRLLAGDLIALGAHREDAFDGYRVRLLQKRGDLLQYLRFADVPVANCYRSDSRLYESGRNDVITVWKDPLSMCFWIERTDGRPFGMAFGNFAELATGGIALTLNGLYLARQRLELRTGVLRAVERMLCAPLGIEHLGVGCQFAGHGPFPVDYKQRTVTGTRLRALRVRGELVTDTWDDISYDVNRVTELELYWKTL